MSSVFGIPILAIVFIASIALMAQGGYSKPMFIAGAVLLVICLLSLLGYSYSSM